VRSRTPMCRTELDELITDLARTARLAARLMTNASIALHQNDLALAGRVLTDRDRMKVMHDAMEQRCITLLEQRSPAVGDLRVVVAALRAVGHLKRMGDLAWHIASIARLKHPTPMTSGKVRSVLARMSLLASQLAEDAATALEYQDPVSGYRLAVADEEVDALRRHLFGILFAEDWSHSVEQAVDAALLGRYYERFADHAVAIARQVCDLAVDRTAVREYPPPECESAACQSRPRP
jgi:phosphate transport system protein